MRKQTEQFPAFDYAKSAETRRAKAAEKEAVGLRLNWTRKQAILAWCHQCMNNQPAEVRRCESFSCPLWPFRSRHSVTAPEMKKWERHFSESADGKRFLKEGDGEGGEACVGTVDASELDLPSDDQW